MTRNFQQLLKKKWAQGNFACVGLDSEYEKIPKCVQKENIVDTIVLFNRAIVETTRNAVCAYKPNIAFYEAHGPEGFLALKRTVADINFTAPDVPVILDAKRADIDNTNNGYVKMAFSYLGVDAITVHPYLGGKALKPFLDQKDKGIFVLCRTSNLGAGEFQDIRGELSCSPVYMTVAGSVSNDWNVNGNCGLVVGATYPEELRTVRTIAGDLPILIPGVGAQGGDLEKAVSLGKDKLNRGIIINSSRQVIFASNGPDFAEAAGRVATKLRDDILQYI